MVNVVYIVWGLENSNTKKCTANNVERATETAATKYVLINVVLLKMKGFEISGSTKYSFPWYSRSRL